MAPKPIPYEGPDNKITIHHNTKLVDVDMTVKRIDLLEEVGGKNVQSHMGLPIITDERMPKGMIVLMGPNGEQYIMVQLLTTTHNVHF